MNEDPLESPDQGSDMDISGLNPDIFSNMLSSSASEVDSLLSQILPEQNSGIEAFLNADRALEALPEEVRVQSLITLVEMIDAAKSEEEFISAIVDWRKIVADLVQKETGAIVILPEVNLGVDQDSVTEVQAEAEIQADAETGHAANMSIEMDQRVLDFHENSFWFGLGRPGAPTVYAVIDPTCPFCARAMDRLKEDVESGNLDMRVILAPLISARAPDVIAGILNSENPALAFWQHELDVAAGRPGVDAVTFSRLSEDYQSAIRANYDFISEKAIPGVPYFVFMTETGSEVFSGVPEAGAFSHALPLPE
jgi:hypothetical protein